MATARNPIVAMDPRIWSSHLWPDGTRLRLADTNNGDRGPGVVISQLLVLRGEVAKEGGCLYVGQLIRTWDEQQAAYDSGRSPVEPGYSTHQPGYGGDLEWTGITDAQFFAIAERLGWVNVAGDDPHWEWHGFWARLRAAHGPGQMAMAMCLDVLEDVAGWYDPDTPEGRAKTDRRRLQKEIWRTYRPGCGVIDGKIGTNTKTALRAMGMAETAGYRDLHPRRSV